jgi:hypothetical protein
MAAKSWMKTDKRLLNVALTYVASFANRMDNTSALFSSKSNHPTSFRRIAVLNKTTTITQQLSELSEELLLKDLRLSTQREHGNWYITQNNTTTTLYLH